MVFRRCVICDNRRDESLLRITWRSRSQLALMLAVLIHSDDIDVERAQFVFEASMEVKKGKHYCPEHSERAALFLVREACSLFEDMDAFKEHLGEALTIYPSQVAHIIPAELLQRLQCHAELLDKNTTLCMRNIVHLINENVSRYGLNYIVTEACFNAAKLKRKGETEDEQISVKSPRLVDSGEAEGASKDVQRESQPLQQLTTNLAVPDVEEATESKVTTFSECTSLLNSPQPRHSVAGHRQLDTELGSKTFTVDGERLKRMFRFCSKCGIRIDGDGCLQLRRIGTAPIVTVCCGKCTRLAETVV